MLWVYVYYKYFNSSSAGIDFGCHNVTCTDVRFWRIKSIPALEELHRHSEMMSMFHDKENLNNLKVKLLNSKPLYAPGN